MIRAHAPFEQKTLSQSRVVIGYCTHLLPIDLEPGNRSSIDPRVTPVVRYVHDLPPRCSERKLNLTD